MKATAITNKTKLSLRTKDLKASPIREILAVLDKPGMISFAGGLPNPDSFPELSLNSCPASVLQYGNTEGERALREQICKDLAEQGFACKTEQILILSGSQQGIDLTAKLFIDRNTPVAVESPTYLAALQVFQYFGAHFTSYQPGQFSRSGLRPHLIYTIPTFQNPTGYCYSRAERHAMAALCDANQLTLFEDDPYRDLYYDESCRTPICSLLKKTSWVYQGSFSKSFAPGLRLGFLVCSQDLVQHYVRLKQASDLHSCRLSQWLILNLLKEPTREKRLEKLRVSYKNRRDYFHRCLKQYMSDLGMWSKPAGGLFFWIQLNQSLDTERLLQTSILHNLAFMPGSHFFTKATQTSYLRLNFSHAQHSEIKNGLKILATLIRLQTETEMGAAG